jgi:putative ABC transport system ATP-binding protein
MDISGALESPLHRLAARFWPARSGRAPANGGSSAAPTVAEPHPERHAPVPLRTDDYQPCPGEPLIEMADIVKIFKTPAGDFTALKGVTTCFYPGEFVSVVGKSGSGKSTLVNMLTGIDHPTAGAVRVGKTFIHKLDESTMSLWRGRNLGIVFQFFQLLPMISLLDNVVLPMDLCNIYSSTERDERALNLLRLVNLDDFAQSLPAAISGGQQQSVAIARALANDPPIIIADEPTGNLDSLTAETVFEIFANLVQDGKTVIMVTHDSGLASRADRTLLLVDGELVHEAVAPAFPSLPHTRLLWLTHHFKPQVHAPGELAFAGGLWLVTSGRMEVFQGDHPVLVLEPGEFLTPLDHRLAGKPIDHLQAVGGERLEILSLEAADFDHWMRAAAEGERQLLAAGKNPAPERPQKGSV